MFLRNSRYAGLPTVTVPDPHGPGRVAMVKLRRLPAFADDAVEAKPVRATDALDAMAEARWGDATRYWHIADANTELEAAALTRVPGRLVRLPKA